MNTFVHCLHSLFHILSLPCVVYSSSEEDSSFPGTSEKTISELDFDPFFLHVMQINDLT